MTIIAQIFFPRFAALLSGYAILGRKRPHKPPEGWLPHGRVRRLREQRYAPSK